MSARMMERRRRQATGRHCRPQQIDLFESDRPKAIIDAPAWPDLPAQTQSTLMSLMARLILEHADKSRVGPMPETGHDLR
jgi:hypothetical protein